MDSNMKIGSICESVGWCNHADFYRHLRQFAAVSPRAARLDKTSGLIVLRQLDEWLASRGLTA